MSNLSTIAAVSTAPGVGAVAMIRISGPEALDVARKLFLPFPESVTPRFQYFGKCVDSDGQTIDEVLLTWFKGPGSFTGEDVVEIACHGGPVVSRCLLERIFELGAAPADPGEFSQRAFLNGKIDLTQAEAIMDLISAQTDLAVKAAGQQLAGRLGGEMEQMRQSLIGVAAHVEAYIDFPDEDIDPESQAQILGRIEAVEHRIGKLLETADRGRILREGIRTVLCGAPNAGKSSLLNQLVGFDRAIVSNRPGTTRDTIEEVINLEGIPLRLTDTAGIRESDDDIEQKGIERSRDQMEQAELVLLLIDSTESKRELDSIGIPEGKNVVKILNKVDLDSHADWQSAEDCVSVSCLEGRGISELKQQILKVVTGSKEGFNSDNLVGVNTRHQHYLRAAGENLQNAVAQLKMNESPEFAAMDIREALESIGAVVGKTDVEEILGSIFSSFCIGK